MSECGQVLRAPPDTPGHDGGQPPCTAKEAAQRLFAWNTAFKDPPLLLLPDTAEALLEDDIGSQDGIPQLLADTPASFHVSILPHASNMAAVSQ